MKKARLFLVMMVLCTASLTAQGTFGLGGGLNYNVDVKRVGVFLRPVYPIDSLWRAAGTFNLFLDQGSGVTQWELGLDVHRRFWTDGQRMSSYLIGGLNYYRRHQRLPGDTDPSGSPSPSRIKVINHAGLNLGAGFQTELRPRVLTFAEAKVSVGDGSLFGFSLGTLIWLNP